jgi:ribosomal-protein-alanine N-acetyltransferase
MWRHIPSLLFAPGLPRRPFIRKSAKPTIAPDTRLRGVRLTLRLGAPSDWREWKKLREASRSFLTPWEPTWPANALSYGFFCDMLRRQWRDWRQGKAYTFLVFLNGEGDRMDILVGGITLNNVERHTAQKGTLGYWMGEVYTGKGYMTEAAQLVCDFAFGPLELDRVEASCLPHNEPSKALLRNLGFDEEGYAKAYLQINGKREDHILWGKAAPKDRLPVKQP